MSDDVDESGLAPVVEKGPVQRVEVVGFDMPFLGLVGFLVKFAIAMIPAAFILAAVFAIAAGLLGRVVSV